MRPECLNSLFCHVSQINGIGPKTSKLIENLCGPYILDVLFTLPVGVHYRPYYQSIYDIKEGQLGTILFKVEKHIKPAKKSIPYKVQGSFQGTLIELVFFNYHAEYLQKKLLEGQSYFVSGKMEKFLGKWGILHPDYIVNQLSEIPEYEAIYPLTAGLSGKVLSKAVGQAKNCLPNLPEWQDEAFMKKQGFLNWKTSLTKAHQPQKNHDLEPNNIVRKRLAYDELLANQLALFLARAHHKRQKGISFQKQKNYEEKVLLNLPFELTTAQHRVIEEIRADLSSTDKMIRLLQGDVGSGKTVVALASLLMALDSAYQGVIMAPTDILAGQHFASFEKMLKGTDVSIALLTGREKGKKREAILEKLAMGEIDILIGTHAVFTQDVAFKNLGLVVIDEQHKFGVQQRLALTKKQKGVNLLVMTATPIPRTLALTTYGDMDISLLDEKPKNRIPVETKVISSEKVQEVIEKLFQKIKSSQEKVQVYWVCPLVQESEKSDLIAAEKRYETLSSVFKDRVGLVHGKMKGNEKDAVMNKFKSGELDVLVSTTVIEVGVDVPTASVIVIEGAERFGLAGLHQLRGRVGRGGGKSICLLLHGKNLSQTAIARLKVMRESENGFVIAEEDLRLRGAGELLGVRQSGLPVFKMADLQVHYHLLTTAAQDAKTILTLDPNLQSERGKALRILLYLFQKETEILTLKAG